VPDHYDWYLFAGDITALPQIARYLEQLPRTAAGWALIEVRDSSEEIEEIELVAPPGFTVRWVHRVDARVTLATTPPIPRPHKSLPAPRGHLPMNLTINGWSTRPVFLRSTFVAAGRASISACREGYQPWRSNK
jgi:NADPH-dependent ferric siderophore reductase